MWANEIMLLWKQISELLNQIYVQYVQLQKVVKCQPIIEPNKDQTKMQK